MIRSHSLRGRERDYDSSYNYINKVIIYVYIKHAYHGLSLRAHIYYYIVILPRAQVGIINHMHFLYVFACLGKKKKTSPVSLMDFKGGPVINGQTISAGVLQRVHIYYILYADA